YKFFGDKSFITTPLPLLFVMAFITGAMCFLMGLLAELLVRTYYESQNKATYMISYAGVKQDGDGLSPASERPAAQGFPRSGGRAGRADLMCGICGFVGPGSGETLERMSLLLK